MWKLLKEYRKINKRLDETFARLHLKPINTQTDSDLFHFSMFRQIMYDLKKPHCTMFVIKHQSHGSSSRRLHMCANMLTGSSCDPAVLPHLILAY